MENRLLDKYKILVEFLAEVLGENTEVVLHDVEDFENSIVAIKNGHISGRKVGDSLTDLALNILKDKENLKNDYLTNYTTKIFQDKKLKSSTYFIKDKQNLKGMLCINIDLSKYVETRDLLNSFIESSPNLEENKSENKFSEQFNSSIEELIDSIIFNIIKAAAVHPKRMTADEKKEITKKLAKKDVFLLKNSVSKVANELFTSEATIYRYLND